MKLLLAPRPVERVECVSPNDLAASEIDLGGAFYDYLYEPNREIVGVRYHLLDQVNFESHPVYRQFLNDPRFVYRQNEFVDMVVEEQYAAALQQGLLSLAVVQDFGGEQVIKSKGQFSIVFELQVSLP